MSTTVPTANAAKPLVVIDLVNDNSISSSDNEDETILIERNQKWCRVATTTTTTTTASAVIGNKRPRDSSPPSTSMVYNPYKRSSCTNKKHNAKQSLENNSNSLVKIEVGKSSGEKMVVTQNLWQFVPTVSSKSSATTTTTIALCGNPDPIPSSLYHIQQRDRWSCGFRNCQMVLTALVPHLSIKEYADLQQILAQLATTKNQSVARINTKDNRQQQQRYIPSLLQIQQLLEQAWKQGLDPQGAHHYGGKLKHKQVWIGAIEVATALTYMGIDATVIQFVMVADSRMQLGPFLYHYFGRTHCTCHTTNHNNTTTTNSSPALATKLLSSCNRNSNHNPTPRQTICDCPRYPLYLQWEGHSVTVIGIEYSNDDNDTKDDLVLLLFDPVKSGTAVMKQLGAKRQSTDNNNHNWPWRLPASKLVHKDTQLILCTSTSNSPNRRVVQVQTAAESKVLAYRRHKTTT